MQLHLIDGTYELFRAYFGVPKRHAPDGSEVGAVYGITAATLSLLAEPDVTHVAAAFDSVIESFRNDVYPGYKTSAGIEEELLKDFSIGLLVKGSTGPAARDGERIVVVDIHIVDVHVGNEFEGVEAVYHVVPACCCDFDGCGLDHFRPLGQFCKSRYFQILGLRINQKRSNGIIQNIRIILFIFFQNYMHHP